MSVPYRDPRILWGLPPDEFNHWRATNDLPILLAFLKSKLPALDEWMAESRLDAGLFGRFVPTGLLFSGSEKRLFVEEAASGEKHSFFWLCQSTREGRIRWAEEHGEAVPEFREIEPYFGWAKRILKRERYFQEDDSNPTRTDSFIFGAWRVESGVSRACLFRKFDLLKLGDVTIQTRAQMGRRNLDLADLDGLAVEGFPSTYATSVRYSSIRGLNVRNALLHHLTLQQCEMLGLRVANSELQSVTLKDCSALGLGMEAPRIVGSILKGLEIVGTSFVPDFEDADLANVEYRPSRDVDAARAADNFRKLRAAYQGCARRREAARMYFLERVYERKALANPYLRNREKFPPMGFPGRIRDAYHLWYTRQQPPSFVLKAAARVLWFKARVWLNPKYSWRALSYKLQYLVSLFESALWGYGEKPSRVFLVALVLMCGFTGAYFLRQEHLANFPTSGSLFDRVFTSAYFSVVTFTTLGYGDILPTDNVMKALCALEALLGAFTMGMVVAGFANRSRY